MRLSSDLRTQLDRVLDAIAAAEAGPTEADLANAPVLDHWRLLMSGPHVLVLWGSVSRHPELGSDLVTTTPLIALDISRGGARTKSCWYRLARSFAEFEAELATSMGVQEPGPSFLRFDLPGYQPIRDMDLIAERLSAYILQVRAIDTADRAASEGSADMHWSTADPHYAYDRIIGFRPRISMDGKGRCIDNAFIERLWRSLKYECIYLHAWDAGSQAKAAIGRWIKFYNHRRPHTTNGGQPHAVGYFNSIETDQQTQAVA